MVKEMANPKTPNQNKTREEGTRDPPVEGMKSVLEMLLPVKPSKMVVATRSASVRTTELSLLAPVSKTQRP